MMKTAIAFIAFPLYQKKKIRGSKKANGIDYFAAIVSNAFQNSKDMLH